MNKLKLIQIFIFLFILCIRISFSKPNNDFEGKIRQIIIRPSFVTSYVDIFTKGASLELGFKKNKNQYSLSYDIYFNQKIVSGTERDGAGGGIGLHWLHDIYNSYYYNLSAGLTLGAHTYTTDISERRTIRCFGGPEINGEIGYKHIFLFINENIQIGTGLMNIIRMGISIRF